MPGIQIPFTYLGGPLSSFSYHLEDGNLGSVNYHHFGAPKLWYFIPKEENKKLERFVKKITKNINCDFYIRHKTIMIPPSVLHKNNIKFARVRLTLLLIIFLLFFQF